MSDDAATHYFSVTDPVWFYDTANPTDPNPAPGIVADVTGENDFAVEITLADGTARTEKHVGAQTVEPTPRWIELRDINAGEL